MTETSNNRLFKINQEEVVAVADQIIVRDTNYYRVPERVGSLFIPVKASAKREMVGVILAMGPKVPEEYRVGDIVCYQTAMAAGTRELPNGVDGATMYRVLTHNDAIICRVPHETVTIRYPDGEPTHVETPLKPLQSTGPI